MSPPPPHPASPPSNLFGFPNFDISGFNDIASPQMGADGHSSDFMALLDNTMLGNLADVDVPMTLDSNDDSLGPDTVATEDSIARSENQFNTADNNVPGAGPLPPGNLGQTSLVGNNSTLTEFTKRRNWPAKIVEELQDFLQVLDADGRIKYTSPNIKAITGYTIEDVQDEFLRDLIHPDDRHLFVAELNESISSGQAMRLFYRFKMKSNEYTIFETVGHAHIAAARFAPNPSNQSPFCQAVFLVSRLYPTKNAALLDSFLEHKIENERLKRRIAELRREEETETDEAQKQWMQSQEGRSDMTTSESTGASSTFSRPGINQQMSEADRNALLTRENLEGAAAGNRLDSLRDKMVRYEGSSHAETIEMLTGLRYIEGERSRGITTGNTSPALIKGDVGIAIPMDRDPRTGEKKKKLKASEEYVCTDCGTLDSPEWRKGPQGPKTLCNACGLRWAKKEKRKNNPAKANDKAAQQLTTKQSTTQQSTTEQLTAEQLPAEQATAEQSTAADEPMS